MTLKDAAPLIIDLATRLVGTDVRMDVSDQTASDIQGLIDEVVTLSKQKGVRLRGVRVGGDILRELGGSTVFINARYAADGATFIVEEASKVGNVEFAFGQ